jgi:hypothetical protein
MNSVLVYASKCVVAGVRGPEHDTGSTMTVKASLWSDSPSPFQPSANTELSAVTSHGGSKSQIFRRQLFVGVKDLEVRQLGSVNGIGEEAG